MKTITDQDIAAAKALASERFGSPAVELVELADPIGESFLFAPFDRAGWASYIDATARDPLTAHGQVYAERVLFPALPEAMAIRDAWPAAPSLTVGRLVAAAGDLPDRPDFRRLDLRALPPGLSEKDANKALEAAGPNATLWSFSYPALGIVALMRAPQPDIWIAAVSRDRAARLAGKGIVDATAQLVLESVVWTGRGGGAAELERYPAVIGDLRRAYLAMGGEGAAASSKRL